MVKLKKGQEAFEVVDGKFAGRKYLPGVEYADTDVPAEHKSRFEKVRLGVKPKPKTTGRKGDK